MLWRRLWSSGLVDRLQMAAMGLVLLALASIPGLTILEVWIDQRNVRRAWTIDGPPCPQVDRPAYSVVGRRRPRTFTYGGVAFTRQFGHASCVAIRERGFMAKASYRVCQFNAPAMVAVTLPSGDTTTWQTGVGRKVTVTVRHGRARCVLAGWFDH
jgi:hypothetical protein